MYISVYIGEQIGVYMDIDVLQQGPALSFFPCGHREFKEERGGVPMFLCSYVVVKLSLPYFFGGISPFFSRVGNTLYRHRNIGT